MGRGRTDHPAREFPTRPWHSELWYLRRMIHRPIVYTKRAREPPNFGPHARVKPNSSELFTYWASSFGLGVSPMTCTPAPRAISITSISSWYFLFRAALININFVGRLSKTL